MAHIIPFPRSINRPFVLKHAAHVAAKDPDGAEKYLRQQLRVQAETMARRGVAQDDLLEEIYRLETAIRVTAWKLNRPPQQPGGAA